ncbi:MAG TPA: phage major capsid protein [Verrucomicrobiales bacterium]|jgi:HK97 family phage major capsid protein|nr:phage major capsid protein [Verrucomicrobiales bacterium]
MAFDESRLTELQGALREKMTANNEIADSFRSEDGAIIIDSERKAAFDTNMGEIKEIKSLIDSMEDMQRVSDWGSEAPIESLAAVASADQAGVLAQVTVPTGVKSLGEAFIGSDEFKAMMSRGSGTMDSPYNVKNLYEGDYSVKDMYSALPSGTPAAFGTVQRDPIVTQQHRRTRVRDLFPTRRTNAAVIEYFRMSGFTNNASVVPERVSSAFGAKPQTTMAFTGVQAPVRTIAHWEAAHRNVLADEPQLRSIIDNELLYGLRLHEDYQILSGAGTSEDLTGILNTSGIQTYSWSAGATLPVKDTKADAVRRAATLSFLAYYEPSGIILHPNDWEDIELVKDSNGQYLMAVSIVQGAEARMWRIPVVDTPAITEGTALIGSFGQGAQLYDREEATIRVSEQHSDFFVRNAIVVLAEQRLALAVKRPESFVKVTFDAAPS